MRTNNGGVNCLGRGGTLPQGKQSITIYSGYDNDESRREDMETGKLREEGRKSAKHENLPEDYL